MIRSDKELEKLAEISEEDIQRAGEWFKKQASPKYRNLLEAGGRSGDRSEE
jgi:hypothetical protein